MGTTASLVNPRNIPSSTHQQGVIPVIKPSTTTTEGATTSVEDDIMQAPNQLKSDWMLGSDLVPHLERGDLVEIRRGTYTHWVVYIGPINNVPCAVHISTDEVENTPKKELCAKMLNRCQAKVRSDPIVTVVGMDSCRINNSLDAKRTPFPHSIIVERAIYKLGTGDYNVILNNCEHFAKWCRYALRESDQSLIGQAGAIGLGYLALTTSFPYSLVVGTMGFAVLKARQAIERHYLIRSII